MLKKFSVENFKGFRDKITLDLSSPCNYSFNQEVISNNCITKGIIYGINSCGKSNLGLAIFDIVCHLTDKQQLKRNYDYYLNMDGRKSFAEFEYTFTFEDEELVYNYKKTGFDQLMEERVFIAGKEIIYYDFMRKEGFTSLEGSETLNQSIAKESPISRVKYVSNNSILTDTKENRIFNAFIKYVNKMLLFYSLDERGYQGFMTGSQSVSEGIIESGKLMDFQQFLKENDLIYKLKAVEVDGRKTIYCQFDNQDANFFKVASTGTKSLALFYYWYIRMQEASFVYIDEFDAFYHFVLSTNIIKRLCNIPEVQVFTTTHNTDLLSNDLLRPDCYFIINDNKLRSVAVLTEKELRKAHNLQKMYKAGAFDEK